MSWIDEIDISEAEGRLADIYRELVEKRGKVSNILKVHSLNPDAMGNHLDLYMTLMFGRSGLSRAEREAIAVVVSAENECEYCVNHHVEALRRYIKDEETLNMLATADGLETLEPRLSNIVRYAEKLTSAPGAMTELPPPAVIAQSPASGPSSVVALNARSAVPSLRISSVCTDVVATRTSPWSWSVTPSARSGSTASPSMRWRLRARPHTPSRMLPT